MKYFKYLPDDIIEYISKKLYREFSDKIKKRYQIKKDAEMANNLQIQLSNEYTNNIYNIYNYNNYYNNTLIFINHYNENIINNYYVEEYDSNSDIDYLDLPELISIDTYDIYN